MEKQDNKLERNNKNMQTESNDDIERIIKDENINRTEKRTKTSENKSLLEHFSTYEQTRNLPN